MVTSSLLGAHEALENARAALRRLRDLAADPAAFENALRDFRRAMARIPVELERALSTHPASAEWLRTRWEAARADPLFTFFMDQPVATVQQSPLAAAPGLGGGTFVETPLDATAMTCGVVGSPDAPPVPAAYAHEPTAGRGMSATEWRFSTWPHLDATGLCEMYFRAFENLLDESSRIARFI